MGNPNVKTIEHIASKMNINPKFLVNNTLSNDSMEIIMLVCQTISIVQQLSHDKKQRFIRLLTEMLELWRDEQ